MFVILPLEKPSKLFFNPKESTPIVLSLFKVFVIYLPLCNLTEFCVLFQFFLKLKFKVSQKVKAT